MYIGFGIVKQILGFFCRIFIRQCYNTFLLSSNLICFLHKKLTYQGRRWTNPALTISVMLDTIWNRFSDASLINNDQGTYFTVHFVKICFENTCFQISGNDYVTSNLILHTALHCMYTNMEVIHIIYYLTYIYILCSINNGWYNLYVI